MGQSQDSFQHLPDFDNSPIQSSCKLKSSQQRKVEEYFGTPISEVPTKILEVRD